MPHKIKEGLKCESCPDKTAQVDEAAFKAEVAVMQAIGNKSERVMNLLHDGKDENGSLVMVLPYMPHGSLEDLLRTCYHSRYSPKCEKCKGTGKTMFKRYSIPLPESSARDFFTSMVEGVKDCHAQGMVHRDLKPGNMMIAAGPDGTLSAVTIIDLGMSHKMDGDVDLLAIHGSKAFMAPEVLNPKTKYGTKCDMFALGVILFRLCSGNRKPFRYATADEEKFHNDKTEFKSGFWEMDQNKKLNFSEGLKKLFNDLCTYDPEKRPSAQDVLDGLENGTYWPEAPELLM